MNWAARNRARGTPQGFKSPLLINPEIIVHPPISLIIPITVRSSLISLAILGSLSAKAGGSRIVIAAIRVTL